MKEKSKVIQFDYPLFDAIPPEMEDITALYLRVSTDMQAQEGYGLDTQYEKIRKYCEAYEVPNPVVFVDDGYTGVNDHRPAYQKMLELMHKGRIKFVITYSLDRIGRNQMLILKFLKEECVKAGCDFLAVKDNIDSRSKQTYGILISILSIFAEFDHDAIVEKLTLGRKQRAQDGYWKGGGVPPFGYYYSKEENNLVVDPVKGPLVKKIFNLYNSMQYSPRQIADIVGMSSDVMVFGVLKNRTYLGEITFRGEQYLGKHEPLIDEETFKRTQEILRKRSVIRGDSHYLLSSLVYCGVCGAKMRYMKWGKGKSQKLKILCYSKYASTKSYLIKDPDCSNYTYDADEVEENVVSVIMDFAFKYRDELSNRVITEDEVISGLLGRLDTLKQEYNRLIYAYKKIGDDDLLDQAADVDAACKKLEREIAEEREKQTYTKQIEENENMLRTLPDTWGVMTAEEKQNVIRSLVSKVELKHGEIKVYLNKTQYEKIVLGVVDQE